MSEIGKNKYVRHVPHISRRAFQLSQIVGTTVANRDGGLFFAKYIPMTSNHYRHNGHMAFCKLAFYGS